LNIRYINFEKEIPPEVKMPKVYEADITDLIAPFKEKWKKEGLEEGKKEGIKQGELKAKIETAKKLLKKGIDIKIIVEVTGLSKKELKKYKVL
jgi:predicted transposase/invertase (TIGR01784 family)